MLELGTSTMGKVLDEIRKAIKMGDIVLFAGKGGISEWIKWFTRSTWSHVGMALRSDEWDMLLLLESTGLSSVKDVESGKAVRGVQLVPLSERVQVYGGDIAVRHLSGEITEPMRQKLLKFRREVSGRPYERKHIDLIRAAYDGPFGENKEDLSSLFCSELVAEAYQQMGLLADVPVGLPSDEYTPRDFSTETKHALGLQNDYKLGKEIRISQ